ncbi:Cof-type HAD-IIB family hydrolase [Aeromonas allosaccharophila]|uniref:Cof-type HAD-IIB family hydrolase n=1 Tax=Aeromonas allosaccharophila TaxID=656 RepID=UPI001BCB5E71|nr:Cof-type HAD-IIB family hydrolase [Aeromonas allosaccharophila]MBS4696855.1 Cof-type HAD-IIB family hydrolase [Aeromonas allosaccharophila]
MFKVVVSDLDGTLLNKQHQISSRTRDTLHRLVEQGVKFVVATGRHHVDVRSFRDALGMDIYLITSNGAVVHDKQDQLVFNQPLPAEIAAELIALERDPSIHLNVYQGDDWVVEEELPWLLSFHDESGFTYRLVDDLTKEPKEKINKVFYIGDHEKLLKIETHLNQRYGDQLNVTFSLPDCLEVMHAGVHKGNAVRAVLEQNGFDMSEAIAFGDGMNDFEMLTMVGRGIVMGNAHDRLKMALPEYEQTLTSDEDGVAVYLEKLFELESVSAA